MTCANAIELIGYVAGPGEQFLEHLAVPVESVWVGVGFRHGVDEAIGGKPSPLASSRVLVGLELDQVERYSVPSGCDHAIANEAVGCWVLRRCIVEHDHVASVPI